MTTPAPAAHPRRSTAWLSGSTRRTILANPGQHHPALVTLAERHAASLQLRVAGGITAFAGSMWFVYVHILLFGVWMLVLERSPWPTLTLIVSLEAIFLSTFVMIGQNRGAAFQQQKADYDFTEQKAELDENTALTREIHRMTAEIHALQSQLTAVVAATAKPGTPATPESTSSKPTT